MRNNKAIIESINPKDLTNSDLVQIAEVEKDMWAYGIGEYVRCNSCGGIHSKNDIYGHLEYEIKIESVTKIEDILGLDSIKCIKCNSSNTDFVYDIEDNINNIKDRLYKSKKSFISILYDNNNGDINGFIDGYVDDFSNIFEREFKSHYELIGEDIIKKSIEDNIGYTLPSDIFSFSSMGTIEKHKNFYLLFEMIRVFFLGIPSNLDNILGISELDSGKSLNAIYGTMGAEKIGINTYASNINSNYNSDIFFHKSVVLDYKENFSLPIREFLKKFKNNMNKILID